jgi:arabinose-5-phosphate isomerase
MLIELARKVLEIEAEAISELLDRLNHDFERAVEIIYDCQGRVVTTGMGKSGIICQKIAATLSSSGTSSYFLHPAEATHGDLGRLRSNDVVLAISNSGETEELVRLLPLIKRLGAPLISLCGNINSTLARAADVVLDVGIRAEACPLGLVPTASTTAALAMGDALAMALLVKRGFTQEDFAAIHPGGQLGWRLLRVRDLMHTGSQLPHVLPQARMSDVILEMTRKGFGVTTVVDEENHLLGIITDGDLRRLIQRAGDHALAVTAIEAMTANPRLIDRDEFATAALRIMEQHHITSLLIVDKDNRLEGLLHLHDLWRTEMV